MALYFTGEIVGVKRKAPEVITMVNGYPHVTYPAFDIVGKILWRSLTKDKYEVKVNNSNCILRVSDCDIFKIDYAGESEIFDSILLNNPMSQPYIYLGEFADHVLNKRQNKCHGFGGFTQLSKKELKYAEADAKAAEEIKGMYFQNYRYDPKFMENMMYPVKSSLTALEELNKREFERIAAEPIRFNIDEFKLSTKEAINAMFGVPKFEYKKIIFSGPCTIILWMDGTKTMARTNKEETFDPEKGVAVCFMKRALGEIEGKKILRKASKDFYDEIAKEANKQLDEELRKAAFPLPKGITFRPFNFDGPMDNNKVIKVAKDDQDD